MTGTALRILKFSKQCFGKESLHSKQLVGLLTDVINRGYDINKQFKVIESSRIKNSSVFMEDMGLYKKESFMLMLLSDGPLSDEELARGLKGDVPIEEVALDYDPTGINTEYVYGTIGAKEHFDAEGKGWELTGVVSFKKGVGSFLIRVITAIAKAEGKDHLFGSVIVEHNLIKYYERFGFVQVGEQVPQKIADTGEVIGSSLEDGIFALRDFTIAFLKRML